MSKVAGERPITPVKLLDGSFVLFRDETGRFGLLDYDCPHRGADLAFGRALRVSRLTVRRRMQMPR